MKSSEAFKVFKAEALRCIDKLGLKDWDIGFQESSNTDIKARCNANYYGRVCLLEFAKKHKYRDIKEAKLTARHEVSHILLSEMRELARNRYVTEEQLDVAEERIATLFEKLL